MIRNLAWFVLYLIAVMGVLALFWFGAAILLAPILTLDASLFVVGLLLLYVLVLGVMIQGDAL